MNVEAALLRARIRIRGGPQSSLAVPSINIALAVLYDTLERIVMQYERIQ